MTDLSARSLSSGVFSQTYRQELALRRGAAAWSRTGMLAVVMLTAPLLLSERWQAIGVFGLLAAIGALGLHLLTGLAGQVSLGHGAFLGIGAYTAIWLGVDRGLPFYVWLPAAAVAAGLVGALAGPLAARLRGLYLAVVTLSLVFITGYLWEVWESLSGGFNGRNGPALTIAGTDLYQGLSVGGLTLTGDQTWWYFALAVLCVAALAARNIQRGRAGRAFTAVRDRDVTAAVAGIPVTRTKVAAFVVSSAYGGLAGALLASYQSYVLPSQWGLALSIQYVAMIVIGGLGTVSGAIAGAFFVAAIPQLVKELAGVLPFIAETSSTTGGISADLLAQFLYGLVIVIVLVFEPAGLAGLGRRFAGYWKRWPW